MACLQQADEEMLLLEAIDMVGLGNWDAVATHVATKTSEQCMQHYHDVYLASAAFPQAQPAPEMAHLDAMQVALLLLTTSLWTRPGAS